MFVSHSTYGRLTKGVGVLLTFMGVGLLGMYGLFLVTGSNPLAADLPGLGAIGQMLFASVGAFALPVGVFLLRSRPETPGRLQIGASALGLMAVVRLLAFSNVETRALVGSAPLVEFFVLGTIAAVSLAVRPPRSDEQLVTGPRTGHAHGAG